MRRAAARADWQGRIDAAEGGSALRWHQVVTPGDIATAPIALLGFACDAGVTRNHGRAGAAAGPGALRRALAHASVHRVEAVTDLGDVACVGDALEAAQAEYAAVAAQVIGAGRLPIGLGGGHEIAWASYCGLRDALDNAGDSGAIGIVNLDAHFDLRAGAQATSGTPFRQILEDAAAGGRRVEYRCLGINRYANTAALFDRASRLGVKWVEDVELRAERFADLADELGSFMGGIAHAYLTVCLDVLPAGTAPGVSAPAAIGVDASLVERLIGVVAGSGRLRIADIAELNPRYDSDGRTARTAARLVAHIAESAAAS